MDVKDWMKQVIKPAEIEKYLVNGEDFINEKLIFDSLEKYKTPDPGQVRDILQKSLDIQLLSVEETADRVRAGVPSPWSPRARGPVETVSSTPAGAADDKQQQLENRRSYYEKGDRRKRAHRLITRGAAIESVEPLAKVLSETEFYTFAEKAFALPEVKHLLMSAVNVHNAAGQKGKG